MAHPISVPQAIQITNKGTTNGTIFLLPRPFHFANCPAWKPCETTTTHLLEDPIP